MLSLVLATSMLALSPEPAVVESPVASEDEAIVVVAAEPAARAEVAPVVETEPASYEPAADLDVAVVVVKPPKPPVVPPPLPTRVVPPPPHSGAGRFVGGAVMFTAGLGLLTAASFEYAGSRDSTRVLIGQVPAGVTMLVAGGFMVGTGIRDQHRLSTWEAHTNIDARPMGTGLIVGGVTALTLGSLAAVATSIAADMDLNAPRSIPAGWATAGATIGTGTALLIAGIVQRARYAKWRQRVTGMPMVTPTRAGASIGFVGRF